MITDVANYRVTKYRNFKKLSHAAADKLFALNTESMLRRMTGIFQFLCG